MKLEDATAFTEKCLNGEPAPCAFACPLKLDTRSFFEKTEKGRWNAAYKTLRDAALFPSIVSALCPAPCESRCQRQQTGDEPVAIRLIEEACVRFAKNKSPDRYAIPPKTERIAVVGAGIAGLSAALCLAQKKYQVTVFEKNAGWGGCLRDHARFEEFDADIVLQFSAVEVRFEFCLEIKSLEELSGFDLICITTGAEGNDFGLLPGWEPKLLTTAESKVYLGGSLTKAGLIESIIQGKSLSKTAEYFLQTGKASEAFDAINRACILDYSSAAPSPRIVPSGHDGYTEAEAISEISRCLKCDCDMCLATCEMLGTFRKKPKKIAIGVFTDTKVSPPISTHTMTRQAYSCNMCGHCKATCPEDVDIGALLQTSRAACREDNDYPGALHDYWLREMDHSTGQASFFASTEEKPGYVFYPGCQLGAHKPEYVFKSYEFLRNNHNAGIFVGCCGAPAYWAGDTERQDANFEHIRKTWNEQGQPVFIFACATCESIFEEFLPEIKRVSLYELLASSDEVVAGHIFKIASVFDPCNARKNPEMEKAVRILAQKAGAELHKLPEKNRCCGYGGHMRLANPQLYDTVTKNRAEMGENPYIVYCVNCREVFVSRGKDSMHILSAVFDIPNDATVPRIDEKRKNAIKVKRELSKEISGIEFSPETREWDALELLIDDELAERIDGKLIALSDIKEAIWAAEKTGDKFIDEADGVCQCNMIKPALTYWVQYKKSGDSLYEVYGAYYHRMRIGRLDNV